jgi:hypothetical protein
MSGALTLVLARMLQRIPRVLQVLALVALLGLLALYCVRSIAADSCLDSGGVFDYISYVCRNDVNSLPSGTLVEPIVAFSAFFVAGVLLVISFAVRVDRRHAG